jgi:hypothetical protein
MKTIRMLLMLFTAQIFVVSALQAKWEEVPWLKVEGKIVIGSAENIWAVSKSPVTDLFLPYDYEYIFQKWDSQKKVWEIKARQKHLAILALSEFIAAADGSFFAITGEQFAPGMEAIALEAAKRGSDALSQALKKIGQNDLAAEWDASVLKVGGQGAWQNLYDTFEQKLGSDALGQLSQARNEASNRFMKDYEGKPFIHPLYRFADEKFETVYDLSGKKLGFMLGATNKQEVWFEKEQWNENKRKYEKWLVKFDGSALNPVNVMTYDNLHFGADGSIYFVTGGSDQKHDKLLVSKLVGTAWQKLKPIQLPAKYRVSSERQGQVLQYSIVNDKEIWLALRPDSEQWDYEIKKNVFCWDGKVLQPKGVLDGVVEIKAVPGLVLVYSGDKWYQWVEDKSDNEIKPVKIMAPTQEPKAAQVVPAQKKEKRVILEEIKVEEVKTK